MRAAIHSLFVLSAILLFFTMPSCRKKEVVKKYAYGVDPVTIKQPGADKPSVKTTTEFISITYSDLFGTSISSNTLVKLSNAYSAFGDKKLVEDIIIKNFLNSSAAQIPADAEMRADIEAFVNTCYTKFYTRYPSEYEKWYLSNMIRNDAGILPEQVYYAFLTSDEYRYY